MILNQPLVIKYKLIMGNDSVVNGLKASCYLYRMTMYVAARILCCLVASASVFVVEGGQA